MSMTMSSTRRRAASLAAMVLIGVLAGGCSSGSDGAELSAVTAAPASASPSASPSAPPSPSPSASPSPSPTVDEAAALKAANIETAKQVIVDYMRAFNEMNTAVARDWEVLLPYWGGEHRETMITIYQNRAEDGTWTEGYAEVTSQEVVEYTPSSGERETVTLDACIDFSGVRGFNEDGSEMDFSGKNRSFISRYVVQREQGDYWTIHGDDPAPERPC